MLYTVKGFFQRIYSGFVSSSLSRRKIIFVIVIVLGIAITYALLHKSSPISVEKVDITRLVTIAEVASLSTETTPLPLVGSVRSQNEAILRTESAGTVTAVYRSVGDYVSAGTIIAGLENSSQSAGVSQARALVAQAEASVAKIKKGARDEQLSILGIGAGNAESTLQTAKQQGVTTVLSSLTSVEDVILRSTDQLISNPDTANPQFVVLTSDSQLTTDIANKRTVIENKLSSFAGIKSILSINSDVVQVITSTEADVSYVRDYLDTVANALNKAIPSQTISPSQIATYKAEVAGARSAILAQLSALASAKQSIKSAEAGLSIAQENRSEGISGARSEDVAIAEASLQQAQAGLRSAQAVYEKTLVRSPISGRISSLTISRGDFASQFAPAAIVSNQNALEIVSYVSENERESVAVGGKALIENEINGVVTSIAPGLDPATKKVEVKIGVTDAGAPLTHGASVSLTVERARSVSPQEVTDIIIPISALKLGVDATIVFSVSPESTLVAHPITIGRILGNKVQVTSGLTPDMLIVVDARGLKEGQQVTLK